MKRIPVIAISMLLASQGAAAQVPQIGDLLPQGDATTSGRIIQYVLLLTVLSVAPSILIMVTSFTRFIVAFSFLRAALGMQSTPANLIITSLALFLPFFQFNYPGFVVLGISHTVDAGNRCHDDDIPATRAQR